MNQVLYESLEGVVIRVLDVELPPERKSKPKKCLMIFIKTLAALLLLRFVAVRHASRQAGADPEACEKLFHLNRVWSKAIAI
jgi:hypothetical protein